MLDLTKTNLVLTIGRQLFILIIGLMFVFFGTNEQWPLSAQKSLSTLLPGSNPAPAPKP